MFKKRSLTLLVSVLTAGFTASAANASVKVGMGVDYGLGVNLKFDDTVNVFVGNDGLAVDYHFARGAISSGEPVGYFIGFGGWTKWNDDYGVRVPVGLDFRFAPNWNLTAQLNPALQIQDKTKFMIDAGLGVSYQF